jgi:hypothetical protein
MIKGKDFDLSNKDEIQYDAFIPNFSRNKHDRHDIMSRELWLSEVETHGFIDYDGYGDAVTDDGTILQRIRPSIAKDLHPMATWIVWYNR